MDWDGPLVSDDDSAVVVPTTNSPLSDDMEALTSQVNPLAFSDDLGIDLYVQCVHFVS